MWAFHLPTYSAQTSVRSTWNSNWRRSDFRLSISSSISCCSFKIWKYELLHKYYTLYTGCDPSRITLDLRSRVIWLGHNSWSLSSLTYQSYDFLLMYHEIMTLGSGFRDLFIAWRALVLFIIFSSNFCSFCCA